MKLLDAQVLLRLKSALEACKYLGVFWLTHLLLVSSSSHVPYIRVPEALRHLGSPGVNCSTGLCY